MIDREIISKGQQAEDLHRDVAGCKHEDEEEKLRVIEFKQDGRIYSSGFPEAKLGSIKTSRLCIKVAKL